MQASHLDACSRHRPANLTLSLHTNAVFSYGEHHECKMSLSRRGYCGGRSRARTCDPMIKSHLLVDISQAVPIKCH